MENCLRSSDECDRTECKFIFPFFSFLLVVMINFRVREKEEGRRAERKSKFHHCPNKYAARLIEGRGNEVQWRQIGSFSPRLGSLSVSILFCAAFFAPLSGCDTQRIDSDTNLKSVRTHRCGMLLYVFCKGPSFSVVPLSIPGWKHLFSLLGYTKPTTTLMVKMVCMRASTVSHANTGSRVDQGTTLYSKTRHG